MFKWLPILSLLAATSAVAGGCTPCHMGHRPFRPGAVCDPTHCADSTCGPMRGERYVAACDVGECDPCDPCGPCYYGHYSPFGPFAAVFRLFRPVTWVGPSCGDRYWGSYLSDPPDCCDPCDCYGNYTGMQVRNCPRGIGRVAGACVEPGCDVGCESGCHTAGPTYTGMRPPIAPGRGNYPPVVRSPAGRTLATPDASAGYAPRVISVDDRIVNERSPQPTAAARRLEAVRQ